MVKLNIYFLVEIWWSQHHSISFDVRAGWVFDLWSSFSGEAREAREVVKTQEVLIRKPPNPGSNSSWLIPTANALFTTEHKEFQFQCVYCNGEHYSASCTKVQQTKHRRDILERNNRCLICLCASSGKEPLCQCSLKRACSIVAKDALSNS